MAVRDALAALFVASVGFALVGQVLLAVSVPPPIAVGLATAVATAAWVGCYVALRRWDYMPDEVR